MHAGKRLFLILAALALALGIVCSAAAETRAIPVDMLEHGTPPKADGWIVPNREYQDESIHAVMYEQKNYKTKSSAGPTTIRWVVVEIKDPSQLRTVLSYDSFEAKKAATPAELVKYINQIVAINDDYVKMNNFKGYVVRQGVFCCDSLDEWKEEMKQDVLVVDDRGDFSVVQKASSADVTAFLAELNGRGREAVNIFTFGPALVLDGEVQEIKGSDSTHEVALSAARTAICQLDELTYAVFAVDGGDGVGTNCTELANFIVKQFPDCKVAYNLDGGGSSKLYMGQKKVNNAKGRREIYGMIYFASAASEE